MRRAIERDGWSLARTKGSHHMFTHPDKSGHVTVPIHGNEILSPGTFRSILQQAGLSIDQLRELLGDR